MTVQAKGQRMEIIHSPGGLVLLNPEKCLKVVMAMKNEIPNTARQDIRKNYDPRTVLVRCIIHGDGRERPHP